MKIAKQVSNKRQAKAIISKIYEADRAGGMFTNKNNFGFAGSVITATATKNEDGYEVEIQSGYYTETSLEEIVNS